MKTLLTILTLFIAGQCFGQNDTTISDYDRAMQEINEQYTKEFEAAWTPYIQQKTVDLILEYAEECYADSTYHKVDISRPGSLVYSYTWRWIHKEPTFPEFIIWLKERR